MRRLLLDGEDCKMGTRVRFVPRGHDNRPRYDECEEGVISGFDGNHVYVRFDRQHSKEPGEACHLEDLKLV